MKLAFAPRVDEKGGGGSMSRCITFLKQTTLQHNISYSKLLLFLGIRLRLSSSNAVVLQPTSARRASSQLLTARPAAHRREGS